MQRRNFVAGAVAVTMVGDGRFAAAQTAEWEMLSAPDGSWRLDMPKGSQRTVVTEPDGRVRVQYGYSATAGIGLTFAIEQIAQGALDRSPAVTDALLLTTVNLMLRAIPGGRVEQQAPLVLGSARGRSFAVRIDHLQGTFAGRVYVASRALYEQMVLVRDDQRDNPIVARFLDLLRLA